jgi:2-dehydro-3-deoxyphosphogluconate aldolase/(4S)-4-hydroxy-2-oxoglutarate aldolase
MDIARFKKLPIVGIMRGIKDEAVEPLVETCVSSGLETIEITMNTEGAKDLIIKAVRLAKKRLMIGAGTVIDMDTLKLALDSGATFIVMPVFAEDVVGHCAKNKIPVFPGALTPQEIYKAWNSGATMVKVFPSGVFGPAYFREIKGPFNDIELLACGGVSPDNIGDYFASGANAVAFGASVFRRDWLASKDFNSIGDRIKGYVDSYKRRGA